MKESAREINVDDFLIDGCVLLRGCGEDVVVPDGIEEIAPFAFSDSSVTSVVLPNTVVKIGRGAFDYCRRLRFLEIPDSIREITGRICTGCTSLQSVRLPDGLWEEAMRGSAWYAEKMAKEGRCPECGMPLSEYSHTCQNDLCPTHYGKWEW